jgi:hypothetical protein
MAVELKVKTLQGKLWSVNGMSHLNAPCRRACPHALALRSVELTDTIATVKKKLEDKEGEIPLFCFDGFPLAVR